MRAETVNRLKREGSFLPDQAIAIAEAIDVALEQAALVTVPILDTRLAAFEIRFETFESRFRTFEARFDTFESRFNTFESRFRTFEARFRTFEARFDALEARFVALEAKMDRKFDRFRLQMIIAILLATAANGPLGIAVLNAIRHAL